MHERTNRYLTSFPFHPHCLNFSANMGISATSSQQVTAMRIRIKTYACGMVAIRSPAPTMSEPQKRALAGVGNPMKEVVCRSSRLNFASLSAEKAAMMNAVNGRYLAIGSIAVGYSIWLISVKIIIAGAAPKVMSSASESSSFPMGEDTCSNLATIPSKKSNPAPMSMKSRAVSCFP